MTTCSIGKWFNRTNWTRKVTRAHWSTEEEWTTRSISKRFKKVNWTGSLENIAKQILYLYGRKKFKIYKSRSDFGKTSNSFFFFFFFVTKIMHLYTLKFIFKNNFFKFFLKLFIHVMSFGVLGVSIFTEVLIFIYIIYI